MINRPRQPTIQGVIGTQDTDTDGYVNAAELEEHKVAPSVSAVPFGT